MKTETTIQANPKIQQSEKSQFRQYASYKPSNVEWLGDVPGHWKVTRLINRTVQIVGGDWGDDPELESDQHVLLPVIRVQDIENEYEIGDEKLTYRKIKASKIDHRLIDNKTLLIEKSGGGEKQLVGRVAIPKKITMPSICSNFMERIEMDEQAVPSFFNYIFHALYNQNMNFPFVQQTTGIQNLKSTYYFYTKVAYPNPTEQTAIAAYLDQATANIDQVIATKQKQLEKLEQYKQSKIHECVTKGLNPDVTLKPSGIDWIGDVPGHWKVERIKDVATVVLGKMLCSEDKGSYFLKPYLKSKNIGWNELLLDKVEEMWFSENELENLRVKKNDILMTEGGEVGKTSIWNDELEECYIQNSVHKITFDKKNNPRYYLYLLNHIGSFGVFTHLVSTVSIGHLTKEKLVVVKVVAPTLNEQNEIAKYLDDFCDKISKEKSIIEQQIEKLKQYRKCLIHECVTGKRKVINE